MGIALSGVVVETDLIATCPECAGLPLYHFFTSSTDNFRLTLVWLIVLLTKSFWQEDKKKAEKTEKSKAKYSLCLGVVRCALCVVLKCY